MAVLERPPERAGGQDDEGPDLRLVVKVALELLFDLQDRVEEKRGRITDDDALRIAALVAVLRRLRAALEEE